MDIALLHEFINQHSVLAPIIFIVTNALAMVCFFPSSWFMLISGILFGPVFGSLYSLLGTASGAVLSFLMSRYFAADWVRKKHYEKLNTLLKRVNEEGWRFVAFARITPFFPYNFVNYGLGLSDLSMFEYTVTSIIFMLPKCVTYTYLGYLGATMIEGPGKVIYRVFIASALLISLLLLSWMFARQRK